MAKREGTMRSPRKQASRFNHYNHPLLSESVVYFAAHSLGRGFDVTADFRLGSVKGSLGSHLVELDKENTQDLITPTGLVIHKISKDIRLDKGERTRFQSDVLSFNKMSERFNEGASIRGRMPLGLFNAMYGFNGSWQADANATKSLALDGWFLALYSLKLTQSPLRLIDEVKRAVPNGWEPKALASFIHKYGTHIIVGVKVGGKNVIYVRQYRSSQLQPTEVASLVQNYADRRFEVQSDTASFDMKERAGKEKADMEERTGKEQVSHTHKSDSESTLQRAAGYNTTRLKLKDMTRKVKLKGTTEFSERRQILPLHIALGKDVEIFSRRRGGDDTVENHYEWMATVADSPDVVGMSFVPINSLLDGVPGVGFLSHAVNLYLRYRPPIEELEYFLDFQVPKQWSPSLELAPATTQGQPKPPALQFRLMGPQLYVSPIQVSVGRRPVTGIRLALEGKKRNRLAIQLQYLSTLPMVLKPSWDTHVSIGTTVWKEPDREDRRWFQPVSWKSFSHINTAPIELNESWIGEANGTFIVTGAQLQVWDFGITKKVLFLRVSYMKVPGCSIRRSLWDHTPATNERSGLLYNLGLSGPPQRPEQTTDHPVVINQDSAIFPSGPLKSAANHKLLKYVDISEMSKGPRDSPGHWLVSGAKLDVDTGKIALRVKYSLLHYGVGPIGSFSRSHSYR